MHKAGSFDSLIVTDPPTSGFKSLLSSLFLHFKMIQGQQQQLQQTEISEEYRVWKKNAVCLSFPVPLCLFEVVIAAIFFFPVLSVHNCHVPCMHFVCCFLVSAEQLFSLSFVIFPLLWPPLLVIGMGLSELLNFFT